MEIETHDPTRRVFDLRVVPLSSSDDATTAGAIGVFFDITQLEKLERVRQEFLSNVSHELKTPLTAIVAFVETLEAGALDDRENSERFLDIRKKPLDAKSIADIRNECNRAGMWVFRRKNRISPNHD